MISYKGVGVSKGIAQGKAVCFRENKAAVSDECVENTEAEIARYRSAKCRVHDMIEEDRIAAVRAAGEEQAQIFDVAQLMLEEPDFVDRVESAIREERKNAAFAVQRAADSFIALFAAMEDDYMRARADDVKDVACRLCEALGEEKAAFTAEEPFIAFAEELTPSQTMRMDRRNLLAFALRRGSVCSHAAILARALQIPMVSDLHIDFDIVEGMHCVLNGETGEIIADPDEETRERYKAQVAQDSARRKALRALVGQQSVTSDGVQIHVYANIGSLSDLETALDCGAEGIGLFRSEFLFMDKNTAPSEDEQFEVYAKALREMKGKQVVIRTIDVGADKPARCLALDAECNPALGNRGIRVCLKKPALFKAQLRALLRASTYGRLGIMFPMIVNERELDEALDIVEKAKDELLREGIAVSEDVEIGIMIETPAAALICDLLAPKVDFFSIGTNDLTQYTTAADRTNGAVAHLYDTHHPAVLRLIHHVAKTAHCFGKKVGICGESAGDLSLTEFFIGIGIDELSVSAGIVLELRDKIGQVSAQKAREIWD